jgi:hypothetical protein
MSKPKTPLIDKNIDKFINNNFDKKDRKKSDSEKFEWFVNSMHIWHCSSQFFNSNTKIGKAISLGTAQGGDAFFISVNNFEQIFSLDDNIDDVIEYIKRHGKSITFHFIQTKKTNSVNWGQFLNLIDLPLNIWKGNSFDLSQPNLKKIQEFIDKVTDEDDVILKKLEHKIEICFYTNKDDNDIRMLEKDWETNIDNKKNELKQWFSSERLNIIFRGSNFLNEIYEKIISNDYELNISKENVIQVELKKYLIGFITAKELLDCIAPEVNGSRTLFPDVFKNNIRLYLGRNTVNEKIEQTLIEEPTKFHFYNNGLTITTKEIDDNSRNYIIKPVNIVNGCQTANSIYNVSRLDNFSAKQIKIPVRIIVAQDKEYENITIRTNTQNGLDSKDLISISNIQTELQDEFSKLKIQEKTFHYKRQKSNEDFTSLDVDFIIQIDDILRATFSTLLLIPNKVSGYFDQTTMKYVDIIFDERFSKLYLILTGLFKIIEDNIETSNLEFKRLKFHLTYLFYKFCNKDENINSIEEYFRRKDDEYTEEEIEEQNKLINKIYSNIYSAIKDKENFEKTLQHICTIIKKDYPNLLDLDTKVKEKILYKPVEKLPRIRTTPIFDDFSTNFL